MLCPIRFVYPPGQVGDLPVFGVQGCIDLRGPGIHAIAPSAPGPRSIVWSARRCVSRRFTVSKPAITSN